MSVVSDAHDVIKAALSGFRVTQPGDLVNPPGVVLGPPSLTWDAYHSGPTRITVPVWAVVAADDRAIAALYEHLQAVTEALEESGELVVTTARPGVHPAGGSDLPAYEITVEVEA